ncbi:MAG: hypothetical protein ACK4YM_08040 [Novosphingobium sp.]
MSLNNPEHPGPALLAREAQARHGPVADQLDGQTVGPGEMLLAGDRFMLRTLTGYAYLYQRGAGVIVDRSPGADPAEEQLWLNGSVYAAIAAINGFLPLHASAVVWQGGAYAFTGPSGAGKSTLAAALGGHAMPLLCDDTLVLDISDPQRILCLPGHKRLKLTAQAVALTGAAPQEKVAALVDKHYAAPPGGVLNAVVPLRQLIFLADDEVPQIEPIGGAQRLACLNDDHYTADIFAMARRLDLAGRFALIAAIAPHIAMSRFARPRDTARFAETTALIAATLKQGVPPCLPR